METQMSDKLFREAVKLFAAHWKKLVLYTILAGLVTAVVSSVIQRILMPAAPFVTIPLSILVQGVMVTLLLRTAADNAVPSFKVCWEMAKRRFLPMLALVGWVILIVFGVALGTAAVYALLTFLSIVAFGSSTPAAISVAVILALGTIYAMIRLGFTGIIIVDTDLGARASLRRSLEITKGRIIYIIKQNLPVIGIGLVLAAAAFAALMPVINEIWSLGDPTQWQPSAADIGLLIWFVVGTVLVGFVFGLVSRLLGTLVYLRLKAMAAEPETAPAAEQPMPTEQPEAPAGE